MPPASAQNGVAALLAQQPQQQPEDFHPVLQDVAKAYPRLAPYVANTAVGRGTTTDDRQLEFYAPWDEDNPHRGSLYVELYNKGLTGKALRDSIALDMLHYTGGTNPQTGQPVDSNYYTMKQQMMAAIKQRNAPMDQEAYQQDLKQYPDSGSYDQWLAHNRADAYIRGLVSPDLNPEWQEPGVYTPQMKKIGDQIRAYLITPPTQGTTR